MGSQTIPPSPEVDRAEVHWEGIPNQRRRPRKSRASDNPTEHAVNPTFYGMSSGVEGEHLPGLVKEFTAWDVYNNESKKVDDELVKDWTVSLNFLLVFAAIFAAVLTAFIIASIGLLQQDSTQALLDVMIFYVNNLANGTHTPYYLAPFKPDPSSVYINCLFFASLSISLVAALASVISLQWVAEYDAAITRGGSSPVDRAKRRQFRFSGVKAWQMGEIIASLPVLLYCSVALFSFGVIIWMWVIHATVAYVVIGGAAVATFFYFSCTILAVLYVSAPFRTPISGWIYSLGRLSMRPIIWTFQRVGARSLSARIHRSYHAYTIIGKRVEHAVQSNPYLAQDALIWLAGQVSISEDSHRRLLLLVSELPALSKAGLLTSKFTERTWGAILDLLGRHYLRNLNVSHPTSDHLRGMSILTQCAKTPEIARMIQPKPETYYDNNSAISHYWEQYCITDYGTIANPDLNSVVPNSLFLLTRDIPTPSPKSSPEIEAVLQLSNWRNSVEKSPAVWQDVFSRVDEYSSGFMDSCIHFFRQYAVVSPWLFGDNNDQLTYVAIFEHILRRALARGISPEALYSLAHAFESLVEAKKIRHVVKPTPCLYRPLLYGQRIQEMPDTVKSIHHSIVLLLSRNLDTCPEDETAQRFYEVVGMLWLRPSSRSRHNWAQLLQEHDEDCGLTDLKEELLSGWIHNVDEVPEIHEILKHLSDAQSVSSELGPLWRGNSNEVDKRRLIEALTVFDKLLRWDCTPSQHLGIIEILCRDLKASDLKPSGNAHDAHMWRHGVDRIKDSCLRMIGYRTLAIDVPVENIPTGDYINAWESSWSRTKEYIFDDLSHEVPTSFWQLRALLWRSISPTRQIDICMGAWKSPEKLSQLVRIFDHAVSFTGNNDGTAFLLHHLHITRAGMLIFRDRNPHINGIPLKDRQLYPVLTLLTLSEREDIDALVLPESLNQECINRVWDFCQAVKSKQTSLLSLVIDMATYQTKHWTNYPEDLACLLYIVTESMRQSDVEASIPLLRPVAHSLRALREAMMGTGRGDGAERELVSEQATKVTNLLLSKLSTQIITGESNLRSLSCARAVGGVAAGGWLPII